MGLFVLAVLATVAVVAAIWILNSNKDEGARRATGYTPQDHSWAPTRARPQPRKESIRMRNAQTKREQAQKRENRREVVSVAELTQRIVVLYLRREAERLGAVVGEGQAEAERVFKEHNKNRRPNDIDLHGLRVQEAIRFAQASITVMQSRSSPTLRLIVGKGLHTWDGVARVKPAIKEMLKSHGFAVEEQQGNAGVLMVRLRSGGHAFDDIDDSGPRRVYGLGMYDSD